MNPLRKLLGIIGILSAALAVNVVLITGKPFSQLVLTAVSIAILAGLFWVALAAIGAFQKRRGDERVMQGVRTLVASTLMLGICIVIYAFAARWNVSWDLTQEGRAPLAPLTVQVLRGLDTEVEVIAFFSGLEDRVVSIAKDKTTRFLNRCTALAPELLKVELLDIEANPLLAQELGIGSISRSASGIIVVRAGGKKRIIALDGVNPKLNEQEFTNAIINVIRAESMKVYFMEGHDELGVAHSDAVRRIQVLSKQLLDEGYERGIVTLDPRNPVIPRDCGILAILAPERELSPGELAAIQDYTDQGGRLFIALDPVVQSQSGLSSDDRLRGWLENYWGISVGLDMLVTLSLENQESVLLTPDLTDFPENEDGPFKGSFNYQHPITRGFAGQMLWLVTRSVTATSTRPEGVVRDPILRSQQEVFAETRLDMLIKGQSNPEGKQLGPIPVAMAGTMKTDVKVGDTERTRDARIVVTGDGTFLTDGKLGTNKYNLDLALNMFAWLSETEELIGERADDEGAKPLILSTKEQQAIAWIATLGVLQVVIVIGLVVYALRRRRS